MTLENRDESTKDTKDYSGLKYLTPQPPSLRGKGEMGWYLLGCVGGT